MPGVISVVFAATVIVIGLVFPVMLKVSQGGTAEPAGTPTAKRATVGSVNVAKMFFEAGTGPWWSAVNVSDVGLSASDPPALTVPLLPPPPPHAASSIAEMARPRPQDLRSADMSLSLGPAAGAVLIAPLARGPPCSLRI